MNLSSKIKHIISFLLHGETKHTIANIAYLQPNNQLKGKKIIVTGGGRGLGFAMAKKFKSEGAEVLIAGRNEKTLQSSAVEIGCSYLVLDVQDIDSFNSFIDDADRILGGVNCLVNNAGISLHENGFIDLQELTDVEKERNKMKINEEKLDLLDDRLFDLLVDYNEVLGINADFSDIDHTQLIIETRFELILALAKEKIGQEESDKR